MIIRAAFLPALPPPAVFVRDYRSAEDKDNGRRSPEPALLYQEGPGSLVISWTMVKVALTDFEASFHYRDGCAQTAM